MMNQFHTGYFRVKNRRDLGLEIKPEAERLEGGIFRFTGGWIIGEIGDPEHYWGEIAMIPCDDDYPKDAPGWIASGDLEAI